MGRAGGADQLMGGDHPAEALACVDHVVPGQRGIGRFGRKAVEQKIGDQPRGLRRQVGRGVEAEVADVRNDARGHVQGHRADRPASADEQRAGGIAAQNGHAVAIFGDVQRLAGHAPRGRNAGGKAAGEGREAIRPGEQRTVGRVGGPPRPAK